MIALALFVVVITLLYFKTWLIKQKCCDLQKLPGPTIYPLIGTVLEFGTNSVDILKNMQAMCDKYGDILWFWNNTEYPHIMISNAKYMKQILGSTMHIHKSDTYRLLKIWLGNGLLVSNGDSWRKSRKLINPTFHVKLLEDFVEMFDKPSDILVTKLRNCIGKPVDIFPLVNLYSLDLICESAMGYNMNAQLNPQLQYVKSVKGFSELHMIRLLSLFAKNETCYRFMKNRKIQMDHVTVLKNFTNDILKKRKLNFNKSGQKKRVAFLDMLLSIAEDNQLDDKEISDTVDNIMFAGHDTITSALSLTIYELAKHPHVQEKIFEEITDHFDINEEITFNKLEKMNYLERVIKESMRLYPPVPFIERQVLEDITMDGIKVPANTNICIYIYGLHRNPKHYPNPEKFDPERFNLENNEKRNQYSYVPFSAGLRNCLGQRYSMVTMKYSLIKIIKNFKILPKPGFEMILGNYIVLKPSNGAYVIFQNRL